MPKLVGDIDKEKDSNGGRKSVPFLSVREKQTNQQAKPQRSGMTLRVKSEGWSFVTMHWGQLMETSVKTSR